MYRQSSGGSAIKTPLGYKYIRVDEPQYIWLVIVGKDSCKLPHSDSDGLLKGQRGREVGGAF